VSAIIALFCVLQWLRFGYRVDDLTGPSASAAVELSATAVPIAASGSIHSAPL
jgi:hypothetical protein